MQNKKSAVLFAVLVVIAAGIVMNAVVAALHDWPQFQRDHENRGITDDEAVVNPLLPPIKANGSLNPNRSWYNTTATCSGFAGIDVTPIVANVGGEDIVFVHVCNGEVWAFYAENGTLKWKNTTQPGPAFSFQLATPAYSPLTNRLFVPTAKGKLFILNASTGSKEVNSDGISVCSDCQLNTPVTYYKAPDESLGRIFFGDWNGPKKYYCYWENGTQCWSRSSTSGGGYYWAGAAVIGDYLVYGDDAGYLTSVYWCNGTTADEINVSAVYGVDAKEIRSSITWNNTGDPTDDYGHIYFTSKGGYCYALGFNKSTGKFNTADRWCTDIGYSTSTPAVYNGKVYVGQGGFGNNGKLYCLDESDGSVEWTYTPNGGVQSSPVISTSSNTLYFTTNCDHGRVYCLYLNGTYKWHFETFENGTSRGYVLQGVAVSDDRIFFGNDGGVLYAITEKPGAPQKPDLTVTSIKNSTIYSGTYNIIIATVKNVGNGGAGTFNVTLSDGINVVDEVELTGLDAGKEEEVKFIWVPSTSTTYTLNVTADCDNKVAESDEGNNSLTKDVVAGTIPPTDVVVSEVYSGNLLNNTENVVFAVVENRGADVSGLNVSLAANGTIVDYEFVPMLRFRDSQLLAFRWTPDSAGSVTLNVSAEGGGFRTQTVNVVSPSIITVSSGGSIQSAVNSASNDTIILVDPGVYNGMITIPSGKSGIRLVANGTGVIIHTGSNTSDVIKILGDNCYVRGFEIRSDWTGSIYNNFPHAGVNISSDWNVVENNYIYNSSCGIKLYGSENLVRCNRIGNSPAGRACLNLMAIAGDCNIVQKNIFDGDTGFGFRLGGVFGSTGIHDAKASNNTIRDNNFTVTGVGGWSPGKTVFGGDPNLVFNNIINDTSNKVQLGRLNWYFVDKVAVENPKCGNVVHGPFYGGNFWLNYTGTDSNNDLLGDTLLPHMGYDSHPLIKALCGDVNCNGVINMVDALAVRNYWGAGATLCNLWAADVNCNGVINMVDALAVRNYWGAGAT
ncbi:MAG: PQQ-binding-like beta-propeller repeat protein, partial [Canidatus Methanoxibalbensis ujae]|nr:PQQ-binding-like beta-propeller repeat protein [Candidatus Methanoxibalbensis ujae]